MIYALSDRAWDTIDDALGGLCMLVIVAMVLGFIIYINRDDEDDE